MKQINNILIVCWMFKNIKLAVRYGASLAKRFGISMTVIHVIHNPFGLKGWNLPLPNLDKDYQGLLKDTRNQLDEIIKTERESGIDIEALIREGNPTDEILDVIKEKKIDLLVMLSHDEGRFAHHFFGGSKDELIRRMPCSILLVKETALLKDIRENLIQSSSETWEVIDTKRTKRAVGHLLNQ